GVMGTALACAAPGVVRRIVVVRAGLPQISGDAVSCLDSGRPCVAWLRHDAGVMLNCRIRPPISERHPGAGRDPDTSSVGTTILHVSREDANRRWGRCGTRGD